MTQRADVGILLNDKHFQRSIYQGGSFEHLPFYASAARAVDLSVIFFSNLAFRQDSDELEAFFFDVDSETYHVGVYQVPPVIHNRALLTESQGRHIQSCVRSRHIIFYNDLTRLDKWRVHQCLAQNDETKCYLPKTEKLKSYQQLKEWLTTYATVYLKPRIGSLGIGVTKLEQSGHSLHVVRTRQSHVLAERISTAKAWDLLQRSNQRKYLIQEGIQMLRRNGSPVDFRIAVQKGHTGDWGVTGIVAKVGAERSHVTNIAVGGRAVPAQELLREFFSQSQVQVVMDRLEESGLRVARQIERIGAHMADLGLDLAVTPDGDIKFIEANARDLRITFRDGTNASTWMQTYVQPIMYSAYLLRTGGEQRDEGYLLRQDADHA